MAKDDKLIANGYCSHCGSTANHCSGCGACWNGSGGHWGGCTR